MAGVLVVAVLVVPGSAHAQSADDARQQRETTIAERARAAEELAGLQAQEGELRTALADLDAAVLFQTGKVESALHAEQSAQQVADRRRQEAAETGAAIDVQRQQAAAAVIKAYIGASGGHDDDLLRAEDASEYVQRQHLLGVLDASYDDNLDLLRALVEDQRRLEGQADAALVEAARFHVEVATAQAQVQAQRDAQGRLEDELKGRIVDWQGKVDQFDAADAQLAALIGERSSGGTGGSTGTGGGLAMAAVAVPSSSPTGGTGYLYPASGDVSSSFGWRRHPVLGTSRLHAGTDIGAYEGSEVWAAQDGTVIFAGWNGGYGNCIMIEHDDGIVTLYGHMSELLASEGSRVSRGTTIGLVGSTGLSTGPHLHFETHVGGEPVDPMQFIG